MVVSMHTSTIITPFIHSLCTFFFPFLSYIAYGTHTERTLITIIMFGLKMKRIEKNITDREEKEHSLKGAI